MKNFFSSWKTTAAGIGTLACGVGLILKGDIEAGIAALLAGIGFFFAKDGDKK